MSSSKPTTAPAATTSPAAVKNSKATVPFNKVDPNVQKANIAVTTTKGCKGKKRSPTPCSKEETAPMFLRKTYHMIDGCDEDIAGWSEDGTTFFVRDPKKFEQKIIPQFFNHSKFSSFVRQLNFYGFRKIKLDPIRIDATATAGCASSKQTCFRHDMFLRGRPDLLVEIKREKNQQAAAQNNGASAKSASTGGVAGDASAGVNRQQEVTKLKSEVTGLKDQLSNMSSDVERLTSLVKNMMKERQQQEQQQQQQEEEEVSEAKPSSPATVTPKQQQQEQNKVVGRKRKSPCMLMMSPSHELISSSSSPSKSYEQSSVVSPAAIIAAPLHSHVASAALPDPSSATDDDFFITTVTPSQEENQRDAMPDLATSYPLHTATESSTVTQIKQDSCDGSKNDGNDIIMPSSPALSSPTNNISSSLSSYPIFPPSMASDSDFTDSLLEDMEIEDIGSNDDTTMATIIEGNNHIIDKDSNTQLPVELHQCLSLLPKEMQQLFVERLVETITHPETFKKHVDMVSAMAAEVTAEALALSSSSKQQQQPPLSSSDATVHDKNSTAANNVSLSLAAATLGTLLCKYSQQQQSSLLSSSVNTPNTAIEEQQKKKQQQNQGGSNNGGGGCGGNGKKGGTRPSIVPIEA